jgi:protein-tyrosine kinase
MSRVFQALRRSGANLAEPTFLTACAQASNGNGIATETAISPPLVSGKKSVVEPAFMDLVSHVRPLSLTVSDSSPLLSARHEEWQAAEEYRILRTKIVQHHINPQMIVVSSPTTGDGKTVTAVNLAAALAQRSDEQILLVDGDFRRSMVHNCLGISEQPGLAEVLADEAIFEDTVYRVDQLPNLYVLPAGSAGARASELLDSSCWRGVIGRIRQHFHRIVVDCPPVEAVADYDLITTLCDGVLLVVRPDHTDRKLCMRALKTAGQKLLGVLINDAKEWFLWKHQVSHYYRDAPATTNGRESKA